MKLYIALAIFAIAWAIFMFGIIPVIICASIAALLILSAKAHEEKYGKEVTMAEIEELMNKEYYDSRL